MKNRFPLSSSIEHACSTLDSDFELESELQFTLAVPTSLLPADCLDALGIPESQPVKVHWTFASESITAAGKPPVVEVTYCGHGRTRQKHQLINPAQATPYDKFLHQVPVPPSYVIGAVGIACTLCQVGDRDRIASMYQLISTSCIRKTHTCANLIPAYKAATRR